MAVLVAYTRVSTVAQVQEGDGLGVQRDGIRAWAAAQGHRIAHWSTDAGVSGSLDAATRPGLAEAVRLARGRDVDGVVVWRLDRLARDLLIQEAVLADLRRAGKALRSTVAAEDHALLDDGADPSRTLIRQVLGAVAGYERAVVRLRLEAGRERARRAGYYAGHGSPPFGTVPRRTAEGHCLLVGCEVEQDAIELMRRLKGAGESLRSIAAALNTAGLVPRRGGNWHPQTVARVLARQTATN